jgi:hypothetical protein
MVAVDFCCFGSCLFAKNFGTKPGHHAVTSFTDWWIKMTEESSLCAFNYGYK